jgi:hypothetical protein
MGSCEAVKQLVELGADINRSAAGTGTTPMCIAAQVPLQLAIFLHVLLITLFL